MSIKLKIAMMLVTLVVFGFAMVYANGENLELCLDVAGMLTLFGVSVMVCVYIFEIPENDKGK